MSWTELDYSLADRSHLQKCKLYTHPLPDCGSNAYMISEGNSIGTIVALLVIKVQVDETTWHNGPVGKLAYDTNCQQGAVGLNLN